MIFALALIIALVALFFIERSVKPWGVRILLNLILILVVAIAAGSMAIEIGKSLERNRFAVTLPRIFGQLQETSEPLRSEQILELKKETGSTKSLEDIENVADRLQSEAMTSK